MVSFLLSVEQRNQEKTSSFEKKDNAQVHTCAVSMIKIMELKIELSQHPPDLAPSDFFFISKLEKMARWTIVTSNEGVIAQRDVYFEDLPKSYFLDGLKKVEKRL